MGMRGSKNDYIQLSIPWALRNHMPFGRRDKLEMRIPPGLALVSSRAAVTPYPPVAARTVI
jgi:hypothetical protein